jgi:hypothetical protein
MSTGCISLIISKICKWEETHWLPSVVRPRSESFVIKDLTPSISTYLWSLQVSYVAVFASVKMHHSGNVAMLRCNCGKSSFPNSAWWRSRTDYRVIPSSNSPLAPFIVSPGLLSPLASTLCILSQLWLHVLRSLLHRLVRVLEASIQLILIAFQPFRQWCAAEYRCLVN